MVVNYFSLTHAGSLKTLRMSIFLVASNSKMLFKAVIMMPQTLFYKYKACFINFTIHLNFSPHKFHNPLSTRGKYSFSPSIYLNKVLKEDINGELCQTSSEYNKLVYRL